MTDEEKILRKHAQKVLEGGMRIWDDYKDDKLPGNRRGALKEKARVLINYDRFITGEVITRGTV